MSDSPAARTPLKVWLGLGIAVALDVPVQLIWKALMNKANDPIRGAFGSLFHQARWYSHQTRTFFMFALFGCQFLNWIWVLGNADLGFAQPFTALSYIVVSTGAVLYLHEHLTPLRIIGMGLILIGVVLVGSSEHKTTGLLKESQ